MIRDRFLPTFSIVFVAIYAACVYFNLAAFTYFPATHTIQAFVPAIVRQKGVIPMFWYGWLTTSIVASVIVAGALSLTSVQKFFGARNAPIWIVPVAAIGVVLYALKQWFTM